MNSDTGRPTGPKIASESMGSNGEKDTLQELATGALEEARRLVRDNPVAAVAVGVGIGFLIGAWLRRD